MPELCSQMMPSTGLGNVVYYSLVGGTQYNIYSEQWIQSIRSLRAHNKSIAVHLFFYDGIASLMREEAVRQNVVLHDLGNYQDNFAAYGHRQTVLRGHKTLHKFRSLDRLPPANQVLYVDCDTYFFTDVDLLFQKYQDGAFHGREDVMTRTNHYGYNPEWLDENLLDQIVADCNLRRVIPYNTGVCLMNGQIWIKIAALYDRFIDYAWRLLVGAYLKIDPTLPLMADHVTDYDREMAIKTYPASSAWIFEEVAMWLTLGEIPDLPHGVFALTDVIQGGECLDRVLPSSVLVAHYWSNGQDKFFKAITDAGIHEGT